MISGRWCRRHGAAAPADLAGVAGPSRVAGVAGGPCVATSAGVAGSAGPAGVAGSAGSATVSSREPVASTLTTPGGDRGRTETEDDRRPRGRRGGAEPVPDSGGHLVGGADELAGHHECPRRLVDTGTDVGSFGLDEKAGGVHPGIVVDVDDDRPARITGGERGHHGGQRRVVVVNVRVKLWP